MASGGSQYPSSHRRTRHSTVSAATSSALPVRSTREQMSCKTGSCMSFLTLSCRSPRSNPSACHSRPMMIWALRGLSAQRTVLPSRSTCPTVDSRLALDANIFRTPGRALNILKSMRASSRAMMIRPRKGDILNIISWMSSPHRICRRLSSRCALAIGFLAYITARRSAVCCCSGEDFSNDPPTLCEIS